MGRDDINHYWDYIFAGGIDLIHWALEHGADITKNGLDDYHLVDSIFSGGSEVICWVAVNPVIGPHFAYLLQNYEWARRRLLHGYYNYTPLLKRNVAIYFGSRSPALLLDFAAAKWIRELRIAIQHKAGSRDLCLADHGLLLHNVASCRKKHFVYWLSNSVCHPATLPAWALSFLCSGLRRFSPFFLHCSGFFLSHHRYYLLLLKRVRLFVQLVF
jgi:hypothetical protein